MTTVVRCSGNTNITVHSPSGFIEMESDRQQEWLLNELAKGNVDAKRILKAVTDIQLAADHTKAEPDF